MRVLYVSAIPAASISTSVPPSRTPSDASADASPDAVIYAVSRGQNIALASHQAMFRKRRRCGLATSKRGGIFQL